MLQKLGLSAQSGEQSLRSASFRIRLPSFQFPRPLVYLLGPLILLPPGADVSIPRKLLYSRPKMCDVVKDDLQLLISSAFIFQGLGLQAYTTMPGLDGPGNQTQGSVRTGPAVWQRSCSPSFRGHIFAFSSHQTFLRF